MAHGLPTPTSLSLQHAGIVLRIANRCRPSSRAGVGVHGPRGARNSCALVAVVSSRRVAGQTWMPARGRPARIPLARNGGRGESAGQTDFPMAGRSWTIAPLVTTSGMARIVDLAGRAPASMACRAECFAQVGAIDQREFLRPPPKTGAMPQPAQLEDRSSSRSPGPYTAGGDARWSTEFPRPDDLFRPASLLPAIDRHRVRRFVAFEG
jgi:hypothetical protein